MKRQRLRRAPPNFFVRPWTSNDSRLQRATSRPVTAIPPTADRSSAADHVRRLETAIPAPVCPPSCPLPLPSASALCPASLALSRPSPAPDQTQRRSDKASRFPSLPSQGPSSLCRPRRSSNLPGPCAGHEAVCRRILPAPWPQLLVRPAPPFPSLCRCAVHPPSPRLVSRLTCLLQLLRLSPSPILLRSGTHSQRLMLRRSRPQLPAPSPRPRSARLIMVRKRRASSALTSNLAARLAAMDSNAHRSAQM